MENSAKEARRQRVKRLSKLALGILRRNDPVGGFIDLPEGRAFVRQFQFNEFRFSSLQWLDASDARSELAIRFLGKKVLIIEWTVSGVISVSYKAGDWERDLEQYDRSPALAGRRLCGLSGNLAAMS